MQSLDDLFLSNILNSSLGIQRINYNHRVIDSTWTKKFFIQFPFASNSYISFLMQFMNPKRQCRKLWKNTKYDSFATKMNFLSHIKKKEKNDAKCKFLNSIFNFWWWNQTPISLKIISFSSYRFIDHKYPHHTRCPNKFWTLLKISKFHKRLVKVCLLSG